MSEKTLFQKIMYREKPGDILYEDDLCVALRDIKPPGAHARIGRASQAHPQPR
jgi:Scavenger mRNA decapping enzyme C-term binding